MADRSKIEWTDASWNPIRARNLITGKVGWHCEHLSPGCAHCYSEGFNARLGTGLPFKPGHRADVEIFVDEKILLQPLRWARPRMIFVCSMTDLFADFVPDAVIDQVFAFMALCPQHTFQVLTKRSTRMRDYLNRLLTTPLRMSRIVDIAVLTKQANVSFQYPIQNVWLGVSAEDQRRADERVPDLLATPAAVRFVSAEPLLGPIEFDRRWLDGTSLHCERGHVYPFVSFEALSYRQSLSQAFVTPICGECGGDAKVGIAPKLDWIIVGGESGRGARPMHPKWARDIRDQCAAADVPFFYKQWGEWAVTKPEAGGDLGGDMRRDAVRIVQADREPDGHFRRGDVLMRRVGKKAAGRLLDGVEHNGMPQPAPARVAA